MAKGGMMDPWSIVGAISTIGVCALLWFAWDQNWLNDLRLFVVIGVRDRGIDLPWLTQAVTMAAGPFRYLVLGGAAILLLTLVSWFSSRFNKRRP